MVNDLVLDRCGLGLTILDDVVGWSVVGIKMTTTTTTNKSSLKIPIDLSLS